MERKRVGVKQAATTVLAIGLCFQAQKQQDECRINSTSVDALRLGNLIRQHVLRSLAPLLAACGQERRKVQQAE